MQHPTWSGFALGISLLLSGLASASDDHASCRPEMPVTSSTTPGHEPAWASALLDAIAASDHRESRLAAALRQLPASEDGNPLAARARVTLAGLLMADGRIEEARATLRGVGLDSEAALDAGLLMAESLAMANDLAGAADWNLRVLRRWPEEPAAADALVQRAAALGAQDPRTALAMLAEARATAAAAAAALDQLEARLDREDWFDRWLEEGSEPPLDAAARAVFYRSLASEAFRSSRAAVQLTTRPSLCARMRAAQLQSRQDDVDRTVREAQAAVDVLGTRRATRQAAFEQQRERYLAEGGRDARLGRSINALRNAVLRDEADIRALQSVVDSLPAARRRLAAQAAQLERVAVAINADAHAEVIAALRSALANRRDELRNAAGNASLRAGELLDPRYD